MNWFEIGFFDRHGTAVVVQHVRASDKFSAARIYNANRDRGEPALVHEFGDHWAKSRFVRPGSQPVNYLGEPIPAEFFQCE